MKRYSASSRSCYKFFITPFNPPQQAPKTCYNFLMLAREGKYDDCIFHRLVPGFMAGLFNGSAGCNH